MYKIGELSKLCRIPVKTLRFYDSEGLLPPNRIDEMTGYRYYSAVKLSDCYRIIALKELGFSLREIKELFSLPKENLSAFLKGKEEELRRLQRQTQSRIAILQNLNHDLKERKIMFDIVIRKSDGIRLAYDRKILAEKSQAEDHLQEMRGAIPQGILGHRTVLMDYEPEFVSRNFDTGLGVEITGKLPKSCGFSERTLSFGEDTASLACACGEYEEGVIALQKYVLDHDYQIVGPTCKIMYEDGTVEIKLPVVKLGELDMSHNEEFDKPFVNDEAVIGHWEMIDFLPCREMFHPEKQKSGCIKEMEKGLYFLPGGEWYWSFGWTKGLLFSSCGYPHRKSQNAYTIEEIAGETYLFLEFKGPNYYRGGRPELWVFRKTDSKAYRKQEIMSVDEIPDLPAEDASVLGKWNVCSLVQHIGEFDPLNPDIVLPYEDLYWRTAVFLEDGGMENSFRNRNDGSFRTDTSEVWRWMKGYVICTPQSTASKYILQEIGQVPYLFVQWKSGDYSFGGSEPYWYVFRR